MIRAIQGTMSLMGKVRVNYGQPLLSTIYYQLTPPNLPPLSNLERHHWAFPTPVSSRVAIVTAAAQGVGKAIALRLATDGLDIIVTDLPGKQKLLDLVAQEIKKRGRKSVAFVGELFEEEDVERIINATVREFGGVDVMVVNDGIGPSNSILSMPAEEWDEVQKFNVRSVFLCYRAAARQMIAQGRGGRLIAASSVSGKQGAADWSAYSASKFAVRGLTQSAASEWRSNSITVNTYAPGAVDVPRFHEVEKEHEERGNLPAASSYPMVSPSDIAGLVSYLVSDEAKFVTGQSYNINGGVHFD